MRAYRGFAATVIVATCATLVVALDGVPRSHPGEADASTASAPAMPEPRRAPVPVTAWAGLAILSGILVVRHIRRRHE